MNLPETTVRFPEAKPQRHNALTRFLFSGSPLDIAEPADHTHPWYLVLWLTGVDYFSTIGYQPGIALLAAGALSVPATGILVLVTVFGAVPIYSEVAARSYAGQGSIALLENLFSGWKSKIFVLILLGFAATDFVITMTLSAADAARHATQNPYLHRFIGEHTLDVTLILLALLAIVFIAGFREAIVVVAATTIPYIALNIWVLLYAGSIVYQRPELLENWTRALHGHGDWTAIFVASALVFPKLALGLSGFETGVSVMPLVNGGGEDQAADNYAVPAGRIRNTRKLLVPSSDGTLSFLFVKPGDVPVYVESGAADLGITGTDVLRETDADVLEPLALGFGACRLVVATPKSVAYPSLPGGVTPRVATKYPRLTRSFFAETGLGVEVITVSGSVEVAPLLGLSHWIVDLVDTGRTLRENGLVERAQILDVGAVLVVNRASQKLKLELHQRLLARLQEASRQQSSKPQAASGS